MHANFWAKKKGIQNITKNLHITHIKKPYQFLAGRCSVQTSHTLVNPCNTEHCWFVCYYLFTLVLRTVCITEYCLCITGRTVAFNWFVFISHPTQKLITNSPISMQHAREWHPITWWTLCLRFHLTFFFSDCRSLIWVNRFIEKTNVDFDSFSRMHHHLIDAN